MTVRDTASALRRLKAVVKRHPKVEQNLTQWYDVYAEETSKGHWRVTVNGDRKQTITFTDEELTINDLHAAKGLTQTHPTSTEFQPAITIDSPGGGPGPFAAETPDETAERVQTIIKKIGLPPITPPKKPTIRDRIAKVLRKIRLRLRL